MLPSTNSGNTQNLWKECKSPTGYSCKYPGYVQPVLLATIVLRKVCHACCECIRGVDTVAVHLLFIQSVHVWNLPVFSCSKIRSLLGTRSRLNTQLWALETHHVYILQLTGCLVQLGILLDLCCASYVLYCR